MSKILLQQKQFCPLVRPGRQKIHSFGCLKSIEEKSFCRQSNEVLKTLGDCRGKGVRREVSFPFVLFLAKQTKFILSNQFFILFILKRFTKDLSRTKLKIEVLVCYDNDSQPNATKTVHNVNASLSAFSFRTSLF